MRWIVLVEWPNGETHTQSCRDADEMREYIRRLKKNTPEASFKTMSQTEYYKTR